MSDNDLKRFSVSLQGVPEEEVDNALQTLLKSFNCISLVVRRRGSGEEDP